MMSKRKGSRKGQDFTAQGIQTVANAFKDITTKKIPDAIGKMKEERDGSRKGRIINTTEHGSYDVSDIDEYVAQGNKVNPKQIMDYLVNEKGYSELKAWATYDVWDEDRFGSMEQRGGSRKGTGPLCELGSVSGKGSRPENLGSIASKVVIGRNRSINMYGEYIEQESREGSRKGGSVTFKDVIDYFENLQETSPKDDDELWDEALNHFGVTTDLGKFDSSEFATYYYGSGVKSTNPIPDDMMVSGRNGSIRMVGQYEDEYQVDSRKGSVDSYSLISDVSREVNQEMFRSILSIYPEVHAGATVLASGKVRLYAYPSYQRNFTSNSQIVQGSDKEITVTFPDVDYMEESLHLSYSEIVDEIYDIVINEINSINYEATIGNLVNQGLFDEPVKSQEYSGVLKESTLQADLRNGL